MSYSQSTFAVYAVGVPSSLEFLTVQIHRGVGAGPAGAAAAGPKFCAIVPSAESFASAYAYTFTMPQRSIEYQRARAQSGGGNLVRKK